MPAPGEVLFAKSKPFGQPWRQSRIEDFLLSRGDIVLETTQFNRALVDVINDVGGFGVVIARLSDGADINEVFFARLDFEFGVSATANHAIANEGNGDVGVPEETNRRVLVS